MIVATLAFAASVSQAFDHKLVVGKAVSENDNTIVVPLSISNQANLVGIDIALKYSAGVTFKEARFENSRAADFDLKESVKYPDKNTFVLMLLPQIQLSVAKPDLAEGDGVLAELVFERTDPSVASFTLEPTSVADPDHWTYFIYEGQDATGKYDQTTAEPKFENGLVALSSATPSIPTVYSLKQNYPNPFNPSTEISFDLPVHSNVELTVYNVLGQSVRTLVNQPMEAGSHTVTWDGYDSHGGQVSSGIYFYRISAEKFNATKKMMMLK